jgi:hypothetical protein
MTSPKPPRNALRNKAVFLSASFPSGEHAEQFAPYDAEAIADAVSATVRAVLLADGRLVFGGHPTISPVVLLIAAELGVKHHVEIFQSCYFKDRVPPATLDLDQRGYGHITWTPNIDDDEAASLELMRKQMLARDDLVAGVFIGGMKGIPLEAETFISGHPNAWVIPIGGPGGATRQLDVHGRLPNDLTDLLGSDKYPLVAWRLVSALAARDT